MDETLTPGTVFAGYRIERRLGAGGMGAVYLARHPRLPRWDALKVLPPSFAAAAEFRARFLREAELAAQLEHRNIVAVHDRGAEGDRLWIAMEFVDGVDADRLLRAEGPLPTERVITLLREAAQGLDEAHHAGLLHRDVKPANLLIESGDDGRVLVADFGIARAAGEGTALTDVGTVVGTLAYTAPETLTEQRVDHRADIYALGCTLFELLTGRKPFPRASMVALMRAHLDEPPPSAHELRPELPPAIDAVIARAMAKEPDVRYSSCGALAAAVASAFGHEAEPTLPAIQPLRIPQAAATRAEPAQQQVTATPVRRATIRRPRIKLTAPRRARLAVAIAGILVVVAAITATVALQRDSNGAVAQPAATTGGVTWGQYRFMVEALPTLLPATPVSTGYQGIRCAAVDEKGQATDLKKLPDTIGRILCTGDENPVRNIDIRCSTNRTPYYLTDEHPIGDERWTRTSGRGRVNWLDVDERDGRTGVVGLEFEESTRNFCQVAVIGGKSGQDLHDRWWPNAPF